jgi:hypothetical protein
MKGMSTISDIEDAMRRSARNRHRRDARNEANETMGGANRSESEKLFKRRDKLDTLGPFAI